jgi:CRISPR/Cas system-associated endonuclease Cas1
LKEAIKEDCVSLIKQVKGMSQDKRVELAQELIELKKKLDLE